MLLAIRRVLSAIGIACLLLWQTMAGAIVIELRPQTQSAPPGQVIRLDVLLTGFVVGVSNPLNAFDISFKFDPAVLRSTIEDLPTNIIFGTRLGVPGYEASAAWGVNEDVALDIVRVAEFSGLPNSTLALLQDSNTFLLASLYFETLTTAITQVEFASISPELPVGVAAEVRVNEVGTPGTLVNLAAGLLFWILGMGLRRVVPIEGT